MLNFPLICQPCRNALFRLLTGAGCVKAWAPVVEGDNGQEKLSWQLQFFTKVADTHKAEIVVRLK